MSGTRDPRISSPAALDALASPVRQEIVDTLAMLGGDAPVAALAGQLGRPADGLYYHLRVLSRAGLVAETPPGPAGGRRFALVRRGQPTLRYRPDDAAARRALARIAHGLLAIARRDFDAALAAGDACVEGPRRTLWAARNTGWLDGDGLAEANALLARLCELLGQPRAPGRDTQVGLAFVLAPLRPRPARR
ncbi:MAG: helix-turn-helix transcriptional regulator [Xanthomonadales bacterium]|nr:helix-turn-helix transcriptional regulator [Xanthomonadales bacterium]